MENGYSIKTKIQLYNAIVVSTLLYGSETVANRRRLEAANHRWLRRILHVPNKSIRERTEPKDMVNIIRKRRLRWLGMDNDRRAYQILHWVPEGRKRRGTPGKNWTETVKNDLRGLNIIMGEGGEASDVGI